MCVSTKHTPHTHVRQDQTTRQGRLPGWLRHPGSPDPGSADTCESVCRKWHGRRLPPGWLQGGRNGCHHARVPGRKSSSPEVSRRHLNSAAGRPLPFRFIASWSRRRRTASGSLLSVTFQVQGGIEISVELHAAGTCVDALVQGHLPALAAVAAQLAAGEPAVRLCSAASCSNNAAWLSGLSCAVSSEEVASIRTPMSTPTVSVPVLASGGFALHRDLEDAVREAQQLTHADTADSLQVGYACPRTSSSRVRDRPGRRSSSGKDSGRERERALICNAQPCLGLCRLHGVAKDRDGKTEVEQGTSCRNRRRREDPGPGFRAGERLPGGACRKLTMMTGLC